MGPEDSLVDRESIHRRVLLNYSALMPLLKSARDQVESKVISSVEKKWKKKDKKDFVTTCNRNAKELVQLNSALSEMMRNEYENLKCKKNVPWWFAFQWHGINSKAGFNI